MNKNKIVNTTITIGLLSGLMYGIKQDKGIATTTLYGIGFGILGMIVGNSISKFYKD
jgi:F0F1-type ATP synthase assembly protein I